MDLVPTLAERDVMRKIICWEGEEKITGLFVEKGALAWDEEQPIPVCWNFGHTTVFGLAQNLHREDDGSITAEIEFFTDTEQQLKAKSITENGDMQFSVYVTNIVEEKQENPGKRHVKAGVIRSINMVPADSVGWS